MLAATLSPSYGIYSGFENVERVPVRAGSEEYLDSEKYELKARTLDGPLLPMVAKLNAARREHPALRRFDDVTFLDAANEQLLAYLKQEDEDTILVVVNLDPKTAQTGLVTVPAGAGLADSFTVRRPARGRDVDVEDRRELRQARAGRAAGARAERRVVTVEADIARLLAGDHHDPHSVLGPHPERSGVAVRALRPGATAMHVLPKRGAPVEMGLLDPAGLFAAYLPRRKLPLDYRLQATWPDGITWEYDDPYARPPSLGELDLHLISEGRHERLWEVLGARVGDGGTAFSVWAPSARGVSVVGDFNQWDGRVHPMRSLGSSGVWELEIPGLGAGERYKFEIRPRSGPPLLKADPLSRRRRASAGDGVDPLSLRPQLEGRGVGSRASRGTGRFRSTRCTSAPGVSTRSRGTARSPTPSSARSLPRTCPTSASRTSSCSR